MPFSRPKRRTTLLIIFFRLIGVEIIFQWINLNILFFRLPSLLYKKERKRKKNLPLNQKINISFYIQIPYYTAIGRFKSRPLQKIIIEYFLGFYSFPLMGKVRETINQPFGLFNLNILFVNISLWKKSPQNGNWSIQILVPPKNFLLNILGYYSLLLWERPGKVYNQPFGLSLSWASLKFFLIEGRASL